MKLSKIIFTLSFSITHATLQGMNAAEIKENVSNKLVALVGQKELTEAALKKIMSEAIAGKKVTHDFIVSKCTEPLLEALKKGDNASASLLMSEGFNFNGDTICARAALKLAVERCDKEVIQKALAAGAKLQNTDEYSSATLYEVFHREGKQKLIINEDNSLHYESTPERVAEIREILQILLKNGANIDEPDKQGITALSCAVEDGSIPLIEMILELGADINAQPAAGKSWSTLHRAIEKGDAEASKMLIKRGASLNTRTIWGYTPLHIAASKGNSTMVKLLLDSGADSDTPISTYPECGKTALDKATENNHQEVIQVLRAHEGKLSVQVYKLYNRLILRCCGDRGKKEKTN